MSGKTHRKNRATTTSLKTPTSLITTPTNQKTTATVTKNHKSSSSKRNRDSLSSPDSTSSAKIPAEMTDTNAVTIEIITKLLEEQT